MKKKYLDIFVNTLKERYNIINFEEIVNCCWYHSYVFVDMLSYNTIDDERNDIQYRFNRLAQMYAFSKFEHTNIKFYDFLNKYINLMGTIAENYNKRCGGDVFNVGEYGTMKEYVEWLLEEVF